MGEGVGLATSAAHCHLRFIPTAVAYEVLKYRVQYMLMMLRRGDGPIPREAS